MEHRRRIDYKLPPKTAAFQYSPFILKGQIGENGPVTVNEETEA